MKGTRQYANIKMKQNNCRINKKIRTIFNKTFCFSQQFFRNQCSLLNKTFQ